MKIREFSRNFPRLRKFIPAKFLNGPIRESFYSRKLILALGDCESLSLRKFIPIKYSTIFYLVLKLPSYYSRCRFPQTASSRWNQLSKRRTEGRGDKYRILINPSTRYSMISNKFSLNDSCLFMFSCSGIIAVIVQENHYKGFRFSFYFSSIAKF